MTVPIKQHLIDPEICIRCYTCEATCPIEAITHNDDNVVVDASICNYCMDCIPVCPTGSIDEWRVVKEPYTLEQQFDWMELPEQEAIMDSEGEQSLSLEALDEAIESLLAEAHSGAGGRAIAPVSAAKPALNLYAPKKPAVAVVQGNYRLTAEDADSDVRHIILDLAAVPFPWLEGQTVGVITPGTTVDGKEHLPRLYSISSPRDGERANFNNLSLTVKRDEKGLCSNYLCDLKKGDQVELTGPFGSTFLMPNDPAAKIFMVCTGTGSAPFRAFTMQRERQASAGMMPMSLFFGARSKDSLPYFGPLKKVPDSLLLKNLVFSREQGQPKRYVQDEMLEQSSVLAQLLADPLCHLYVCGLRAMEEGVESSLAEISKSVGRNWQQLRNEMREQGRYHVETY